MSMLLISTDGRMVFYFGRFSQSVSTSFPLLAVTIWVLYVFLLS